MNANIIDLPKMLADLIKDLPEDSEMTFDDFFNLADVPKDQRSDFAMGAILNQAAERGLL